MSFTKNDVKRITALLEKLNKLSLKGELQEDYREVLRYMLEHNNLVYTQGNIYIFLLDKGKRNNYPV